MVLFGFKLSSIEMCDYFLHDLCRVFVLNYLKPKDEEQDEIRIVIPENEMVRFANILTVFSYQF